MSYIDLKSNRDNMINDVFQIEIALSQVCNRKCTFCPQSQKIIATNPHFISLETIQNIANKTKNFTNLYTLAGMGEPLLHPHLLEIIQILKQTGKKIQIITNGDNLKNYPDLPVDYVDISVYSKDHEEQIKPYLLPHYVLKRQYDIHDKTTFFNRGGNIDIDSGVKNPANRACYYPFMLSYIDTDGAILLCPSDVQRQNILGNINTDSFEDIWNGEQYNKIRNALLSTGRNDILPCKNCNIDGLKYGGEYVQKWLKKR